MESVSYTHLDVYKRQAVLVAEFGLRIAFHSRNTLGKLLTVKHSPNPVFDTKNIIYSIPCKCGCEYMSESSRPLQVRVNEHRVNV